MSEKVKQRQTTFSGLRSLAGRLKRLFQKVICLHHDLVFIKDLDGKIDSVNCDLMADFAELKIQDISRLEQAMKFAGEFRPGMLQQRFRDNEIVWAVIKDERIVHYGFVTFQTRWLDIVEQDFTLKDKEAFIYNCHTLKDWRGRGFFTCSLMEMLRRLSDLGMKRCYIDADARNKPSIRAIYSAGFQLYQSRYMMRILGNPLLRLNFNK